MGLRSRASIQALFLLNLGLQIGDGVLTYYGLQQGFQEGNPFITATVTYWGTAWGLLFWKMTACGLVVLLRCLAASPSARLGLAITAGSYLLLSIVPWTGLLFFA